jgi:hypothetical protein
MAKSIGYIKLHYSIDGSTNPWVYCGTTTFNITTLSILTFSMMTLGVNETQY